MTKQEILGILKEEKIHFFRLQFCDVNGMMKNVGIPKSQIEKALDGEMMFDGSSIDGFARIEESDMYLKPDFDTFSILPWRNKEGISTARIMCDVYSSDDIPFPGCPRVNLKRVLNSAKEMGYTMNVGTEAEFFLFKLDKDGMPTTTTDDESGYFSVDNEDYYGIDCRREIIETLEMMGFEVETSHHEVAPGQHEISFKYADAVRCADNTITFKWVVKTIALRRGLHATFMPKPVFGVNGSGMHTNQSLFKLDGTNAFYDENDKDQLSNVAYNYIAGILENAKGFCAVTSPLVNSYKRLVPGYEAPVYISWSASNRSALVRIPSSRGVGTRVEVRCPDPSCNPYMAFAMMLSAGLDGIKKDLAPPKSVDLNIYDMSCDEKRTVGITTMPPSLGKALEEYKKNPISRETLGNHIYEKYLFIKEAEWESYRIAVTDWELDQYLRI